MLKTVKTNSSAWTWSKEKIYRRNRSWREKQELLLKASCTAVDIRLYVVLCVFNGHFVAAKVVLPCGRACDSAMAGSKGAV